MRTLIDVEKRIRAGAEYFTWGDNEIRLWYDVTDRDFIVQADEQERWETFSEAMTSVLISLGSFAAGEEG